MKGEREEWVREGERGEVSEWGTEGRSEWVSEGGRERKSEWGREGRSEWVREGGKDWVKEWVSGGEEWVSERGREGKWVIEGGWGGVNEGRREGGEEWVNERVSRGRLRHRDSRTRVIRDGWRRAEEREENKRERKNTLSICLHLLLLPSMSCLKSSLVPSEPCLVYRKSLSSCITSHECRRTWQSHDIHNTLPSTHLVHYPQDTPTLLTVATYMGFFPWILLRQSARNPGIRWRTKCQTFQALLGKQASGKYYWYILWHTYIQDLFQGGGRGGG